MKKITLVALLVLAPSAAFAKVSMNRGGLGFLFPDNNSFSNPAQFALSTGFAFQAGYTRGTVDGSAQTATPSIVYGSAKSKVGFGVYGSRSGADLTDTATAVDTVGAGLGMMLGKSVTLGVGYDRRISSGATGSGTVSGSLNYMASKKGMSLGLGFSSTLGEATNVQTGRAAIGYTFKENSHMEAGVRFDDIQDFSNWAAVAALVVGGKSFYFGALYEYGALAQTHTIGGRLGLIFGEKVDLSVTGSKTLSLDSITYGGTLRFAF